MRFPHNAKIFRGQLDAAPFLGVFFLLIMFLLLNSSFVFTPGVPVYLPRGENLPGAHGATAVVTVDQGGNLYFENQLCDEARLKERLRAAVKRSREPLTLVVQMDEEAKIGVQHRLASLARSLGIRNVLLAARPPVEPLLMLPQLTP
jgi:biopolymer transport protein ExbD